MVAAFRVSEAQLPGLSALFSSLCRSNTSLCPRQASPHHYSHHPRLSFLYSPPPAHNGQGCLQDEPWQRQGLLFLLTEALETPPCIMNHSTAQTEENFSLGKGRGEREGRSICSSYTHTAPW